MSGREHRRARKAVDAMTHGRDPYDRASWPSRDDALRWLRGMEPPLRLPDCVILECANEVDRRRRVAWRRLLRAEAAERLLELRTFLCATTLRRLPVFGRKRAVRAEARGSHEVVLSATKGWRRRRA